MASLQRSGDWFQSPIGVVSKLQRLQNNVARIVTRSDRRADAGPLLRQLHWLPVNYRVNFKIALLTYKTRTTTTPSYLLTLLSAKRDTGHHLRSSASTQLLNIPSVRTDFAARAFRVVAPSIWNSLPLTILSSPSLSVFKSRLKTFLFRQASIWLTWSDRKRLCILRIWRYINVNIIIIIIKYKIV